MGSALYNFYKNGELKVKGTSITEGIGQSRITENLKKAEIDESFQVNDKDALKIIFNLLKEEGLVMGGSTGININGAMQLAKKLGPGSTIVTILCDYGTRYFSKVYNKKFLRSKKLPVPDWLK
ncbi:MAG: putative siderophore biosynthesis protein SbnA [Alphaproteobacteria bacterium MarineAlpha6_Bin6]|nr:MAG: putative siderophore biosynthesis protein SbnA [Alphaproteobacteria bacterium MarineAlpha6_Bin6]